MTLRRIAIAALAALGAGCDTMSKGPYAEAQMRGPEGSRIWGRVTFHQPEGGSFLDSGTWRAPGLSTVGDSSVGKIYIRADINGLPPGQTFAIHVHEKGDCSNNGMGAGGHFNPESKPHGRYDALERHAGDLPNLQSNGEGVAVYVAASPLLTVAPGPFSVIDRSVVIHEKADDYRSQPAGNSGARIACGVIRGGG